MAVNIIIQDDTGSVENANSYIDMTFAKAYWDNQLYDYSGKTDDEVNSSLIRATEHIDYYKRAFKNALGVPLNGQAQTTAFPRQGLYDCSCQLVKGIPRIIKNATAEYALALLSSGSLNPTEANTNVKRIKNRVEGAVEKEVEYFSPTTVSTAGNTKKADSILNSSCFFDDNTVIGRG